MFVSQMDQIELYTTDDSSESVEEVRPRQKLPPPLIDLTLDDTISNLNSTSIKAKNFNVKAPLVNNRISDTSNVNNRISDMNDVNNPSHWTDDMIQFYNEDWGGEAKFSVAKIQSTMDKDPSLWEISSRDLLFRKNRRVRSHLKCLNCCQFGHNVFQCQEEMQIPKCYMCGGAGHEEATCPRAICLTCGSPTAVYVMSCFKCVPDKKTTCSSCYLHGHHFINCSDNWRRFHSTIGKTTVEVPQNRVYKPPKDLWCCNCSRKGHNQINCRTRDRCVFPDTFPYVVTYDTPFKQGIYRDVREEPVASTSTSQTVGCEHTQTSGSKRPDSKWMRNLSKSNQKKRKRRKKKSNTTHIRLVGLIQCE